MVIQIKSIYYNPTHILYSCVECQCLANSSCTCHLSFLLKMECTPGQLGLIVDNIVLYLGRLLVYIQSAMFVKSSFSAWWVYTCHIVIHVAISEIYTACMCLEHYKVLGDPGTVLATQSCWSAVRWIDQTLWRTIELHDQCRATPILVEPILVGVINNVLLL